jgi:hypothetical protein
MRIKHFDRTYNGIAIVIEDEDGFVQVYLKCGRRTQHLINVGVADKAFDDVTEDDVDRYIQKKDYILDDIIEYVSNFFPRKVVYESDGDGICVDDDELEDESYLEELNRIDTMESEWFELKTNVIKFGEFIENELGRDYSEKTRNRLVSIFEETELMTNKLK